MSASPVGSVDARSHLKPAPESREPVDVKSSIPAIVCALFVVACGAVTAPREPPSTMPQGMAECNGPLDRERSAQVFASCVGGLGPGVQVPQGIWTNEVAKSTVVGNPPAGQTIIRLEDGSLYIRDSTRRWVSHGSSVTAIAPLTMQAEMRPGIAATDQHQCVASMILVLQKSQSGTLRFVLMTQNEDCADGTWIRTGELTPDAEAEQRREEDHARLKALGYTPDTSSQ